MQTPKTDFAALFPDGDKIRKTLYDAAPQYFRCPNGHSLPHRVTWGRCCPVECAEGKPVRGTNTTYEPHVFESDLKMLGHEKEAVMDPPDDTVEAEFRMEEARAKLGYLRTYASNVAKKAFHDIPELPKAPAHLTGKEYVDQRLTDITPWLLEHKIAEVRLGTAEKSSEAVADLLDRTGLASKKKDGDGGAPRAVVFNVYGGKLQLPFMPQPKDEDHGRKVEGKVVARGDHRREVAGQLPGEGEPGAGERSASDVPGGQEGSPQERGGIAAADGGPGGSDPDGP